MADSALAVTNPIPGVLNNAKVYREGLDQVGVANLELPNFESLTENLGGLGIAGEIEMPVKGHFKSMAVKLTWNTVNDNAIDLLEPKAHHLDIRGSLQEYDPGTGEFVDKPVKVVVRSIPKTNGIGKWEPGKKMDPETTLEVAYIKLWIGGQERVELDKFNFIYRVNGRDMLSGVRANLGL